MKKSKKERKKSSSQFLLLLWKIQIKKNSISGGKIETYECGKRYAYFMSHLCQQNKNKLYFFLVRCFLIFLFWICFEISFFMCLFYSFLPYQNSWFLMRKFFFFSDCSKVTYFEFQNFPFCSKLARNRRLIIKLKVLAPKKKQENLSLQKLSKV